MIANPTERKEIKTGNANIRQTQTKRKKMNKLISLIRNGEFRKAKKLLQTELENNKADVYLLTQMANVLWNLGKDEEALAFIEKAQESNSGYPLMLFTKGRLLWSLERYEEAIAVWDMLLRSETTYLSEHGWGKRWAKSISNDALFYKALCLSALHRIKEAKLLMEEHLSKRRVGQESDFTAKEAKEFLRRLTYSSGKTIAYENEERGWASSKQWQNMEKQFAKKKMTN